MSNSGNDDSEGGEPSMKIPRKIRDDLTDQEKGKVEGYVKGIMDKISDKQAGDSKYKNLSGGRKIDKIPENLTKPIEKGLDVISLRRELTKRTGMLDRFLQSLELKRTAPDAIHQILFGPPSKLTNIVASLLVNECRSYMGEVLNNSTVVVPVEKARGMLPIGRLPTEFVEFLKKIESLELIYEAHLEQTEQNKTKDEPEPDDWSFASHHSTTLEYLTVLDESWEKLITLESGIMNNLTIPDVSDTPGLVFKFRYKSLWDATALALVLPGEIAIVRELVIGMFELGIGDPLILEDLRSSRPRNTFETYFTRGHSTVGFFSETMDHLWKQTPQDLVQLKSVWTSVTDAWKKQSTQMIGMDDTLQNLYYSIQVLVELNTHLQDAKHKWSQDMSGQWPFGDFKITKLYVLNVLFDKLPTLDNKWNANVQSEFLTLKAEIKRLYKMVYIPNSSIQPTDDQVNGCFTMMRKQIADFQLKYQFPQLKSKETQFKIELSTPVGANMDNTDKKSTEVEKGKKRSQSDTTDTRGGKEPRKTSNTRAPLESNDQTTATPKIWQTAPKNRFFPCESLEPKSHICWGCLKPGHYPWTCKNLGIAIATKDLDMLPSAIHDHLDYIGDTPLTVPELEKFMDPEKLDKIRKKVKGGKYNGTIPSMGTFEFTEKAKTRAKTAFDNAQKKRRNYSSRGTASVSSASSISSNSVSSRESNGSSGSNGSLGSNDVSDTDNSE